MMENFDNIPSEDVKLQVRHLIDTLHANAGSYDSDEVVATLRALYREIQAGAQSHHTIPATLHIRWESL